MIEPPDTPDDLARRSAAGDVQATFTLAIIHLNGMGVPRDAAVAHDLLREAAGRGHDAAARVRAHLVGAGVGVPRDVVKARQMLARIAGRDVYAATQLDMLNNIADPAEPRRHVVNRNPDVILVEGLISKEECLYLISLAAPRVTPALVDNNAPAGGRRDPHRTSYDTQFGPAEEDLVINRINHRIARATGTRAEWGEPLHILRYTPGQEYKRHMDTIAGARNQRFWTALVYLNDGYGGGETDFPRLDIRVEGAAGDALLFRSLDADDRPDPRTTHAGMPVTTGTKWLATRWVRSGPYDPDVD